MCNDAKTTYSIPWRLWQVARWEPVGGVISNKSVWHDIVWYLRCPKCSTICIFGPWLEWGYSAFMCIQLLTCRNVRTGTCGMHAKADSVTPGVSARESYSCVWTCDHSRRTSLGYLCDSAKSVWRRTSCGWTEKGSGSGNGREIVVWGSHAFFSCCKEGFERILKISWCL